ncbi:hypothetical protein C8A00DRAFT_36377 [Chaetomidium leptoderma]|uniref:F-box domain-containing protein n=1 Tax=Chaetomidium leptoderma TaxID=669021 RepID=A0AAN6ZT71_9PEZI|nr:hypothetical protein C8A00DRAFT_36377 [Chaetomidium leptoderma]
MVPRAPLIVPVLRTLPLHTLTPELLVKVSSHLSNGSLLSLSLTTRRVHELLLRYLYTRSETITAAAATAEDTTERDDLIRADFYDHEEDVFIITNLHRALYHGLQTRQRSPIALVRELAPRGFVLPARAMEVALQRAATDRDQTFAEFLLFRFGTGPAGGVLREALASGRVVKAVLDVAAVAKDEKKEEECFVGVVKLLVRFVGGEEGGNGRREKKMVVAAEEGLLEAVMVVGEKGCEVHEGSSCFLEMVKVVSDRDMVNFTGVTRSQLEGWIEKLPEHQRLLTEYHLASTKGSLFPAP